MEEAAYKITDPLDEQKVAVVSIAISLKRIADAIEGTPSTSGLAEHMGNCLQDALTNIANRG